MATCYHCLDGRHSDCVGVPCQCPCPVEIQMSRDCAICRGQGTTFGHWAWHEVCRAELNPVALIQFIDSGPQLMATRRIREYIIGVTGMDVDAAKKALATEGECPGCGCSRWACDTYRTSGTVCCPDCGHGKQQARMEG